MKLNPANYARKTKAGNIEIRPSALEPYPGGYFTISEARELAYYILELAGESAEAAPYLIFAKHVGVIYDELRNTDIPGDLVLDLLLIIVEKAMRSA